jgi:hypothetical protein
MTETESTMAPEEGQPNAPAQTAEADEDQLIYASLLAKGMFLGLGILLVTFMIYMTGIVQPGIPIEELPRLWTLSAHEYLEAVNHEFLHRPEVVDGWGWVALLGMSDYLNFVGIALLSAITILCYIRILPNLYRKKDYIYTAIAALEVIVLTLAASGLVAVGH